MILLLILLSICSYFTGGSQLLGGYRPINKNDDNFKYNISTFVLASFQAENPSLVTIENIDNPESQISSGVNYRAMYKFNFYNCAPHSDPTLCTLLSTQDCLVVVYDVLWLKQREITNVSCSEMVTVIEKRKKRSIEKKEKETVDSEFNDLIQNKQLIDFTLNYLNSKSKGVYILQAQKLHFLSKEFLSDIIYVIIIELNMQSCRNQAIIGCQSNKIIDEKINCTLKISQHGKLSDNDFILNSFNCSKSLINSKSRKLYFRSTDINKNPDYEKVLSVSKLLRYSDKTAFNLFKNQYKRMYLDEEEESKRFKIFINNMERAKFIQDHDMGTAVYGATEFADLSVEEFKLTHLSPKWDKSKIPKNLKEAEIPKMTSPLPSEFDWRKHNAVTEVKNQGFCGSCWAFSVTGNIEGQYATKKGILYSLSEQELIDCDKLDAGCNGGLPYLAYQEIQRLGGLETEDDYPYTGRDDKCTFNQTLQKVNVNGYLNISSNETEMQAWLIQNGPMSIGINAFAMQFYFYGVSHPWHITCPPDLDHGVLIVGYGTKKGWFHNIPYWIVKNSWSKYWGEKGYYLVYRGDGTCGLNEMVSSAIV